MSKRPPNVVNQRDVEEKTRMLGEGMGGHFKALTPAMREMGGSLGVNRFRVPPGRATLPFHYHMKEDEFFYVLAGRGLLRYGEEVVEIGEGDCISCPAGKRIAHQIANPFEDDLVYLAVGPFDPDEVCVYPDTGKVLVRSLSRLMLGEDVDYHAGEPEPPRVLSMKPTDEA